MSNKIVNELRPELMASAAMNAWNAHDSSARIQMLGSHEASALPVKDCQTRRVLTGMEREFGRVTFDVRIPVNAEVVDIIRKYNPALGSGGIKSNPTTVIVYMDDDTKIFDVLEFSNYHTMHQRFGFMYKDTPAMQKVRSRALKNVGADTVLAKSPTLDDQGNYRLGLNVKTLMADVPGVTEDGIVVSESFCRRATTTCIEKRDSSWGKKWYPLNLYGDDEHYKPFPDIGDKIRDDGLIFALRRVPEDDEIILAPLDMSPAALREVNMFFDRREYGKAGAEVIDITVRTDGREPAPTPKGMEVQTEKYYQEECKYHAAILDCYKRLYQRHREHLVISPKFQAMLREAQMYLPCPIRSKSTQIYQHQPLDNWRVDITYKYDFVPTIGSKFTGLHGDKGVICQKWPDEDMPVNAWGERAEVIAAPLSTMNRMNIGRPMEHQVNGSIEMVTEAVRLGMGWKPHHGQTDAQVFAADLVRAEMARRGLPIGEAEEEMFRLAKYIDGDYERAFSVLRRFYELCSPRMNDLFDSPGYNGTPESHVKEVLEKGIYIWVPIDSPKLWVEYEYDYSEFDQIGYELAMENYRTKSAAGDEVPMPSIDEFGARPIRTGGVLGDLEVEFPARESPVWYRGRSGNAHVTQDSVLLADTYMFLLDKTAADWSAVASGRHQHHGLPAKLSKQDKYSNPASANPVRIFGEAEVRLTTTVGDGDAVADMLEMSNSPAAHKNVVENILRSETPTNIEEVLDRSKIAPGSSRSQVFVIHTLQCAGIEFFYVDHSDEEEIYPPDAGGVMREMGLIEEDEVEDDDESGAEDSSEDGDDSEAGGNDD